MAIPVFLWLIWLPLAAAPLVYLLGRLLPGRQLGRWTAFLALLATWIPFVLTWQAFLSGETLSYTLGQVTLRVDGISLLVAAVVLALATLTAYYSAPTLEGATGEEKYYAMLVAMTGSMIGLGCAADLFNLWIWFETMAVTSYLLVAYYRDQPVSLEAGVKYLVQSVTGSVLVLFGIALVLAHTGTLALADIQARATTSPILLAAGGLFIVGFGVKIAIVPLHTWLPDAYSQAPSGISAMLSGVVIKVGLVALLRALAALAGITSSWGLLLMGMGALNMFVGNLLAWPQTEVKRLLAYSSLSHVGYMLLGVGITIYAGEVTGAEGGFFHVITHGLMIGLAFFASGALLYALHTITGDHTPLTIEELSGSAWRYPLVAAALTLALLGLGGIPPLAGFMSKWRILMAGMGTGQLLIIGFVAFAALNSVFSLAYYMPLVQVVFRREMSLPVRAGRALPQAMTLPIVLLAVAIVAIGLWPNLLRDLTAPAGAALLTMFAAP